MRRGRREGRDREGGGKRKVKKRGRREGGGREGDKRGMGKWGGEVGRGGDYSVAECKLDSYG